MDVVGTGDSVNISGGSIYGQNNDSFTVTGSSDLITNGTASSTTVTGNGDNLAYIGASSSVAVTGTGETIDINNGKIYGANGDSYSVIGSNDSATNGTASTTSFDGNSDTLSYVGAKSIVDVVGTGEILDMSSGSIYGQNNDSFTVNGSSDLITNGLPVQQQLLAMAITWPTSEHRVQ